MDIYVLIYEENSDSRCGASVDLFQDIKDAQKENEEQQRALDNWWRRYHRADSETRRLMACGKKV